VIEVQGPEQGFLGGDPAAPMHAEIDTDRQPEQQQRCPRGTMVKLNRGFSAGAHGPGATGFGNHPGRPATGTISPGWELGGKGGGHRGLQHPGRCVERATGYALLTGPGTADWHRIELPGRERPLLQAPAGADAGYRCRSQRSVGGRADFALGPVQLAVPRPRATPRGGQAVRCHRESSNNHRCRSGWVRLGPQGSWRRCS